MKPIQRMLVASDGSACADAAAAMALQLALPPHAALDVVTVIDTSGWTDVSAHPDYRRRRVAELHEEARLRLRLAEWDASILRKLETLDGIYSKFSELVSNRRMEVLEWIIILLIAFEIILSLTHG